MSPRLLFISAAVAACTHSGPPLHTDQVHTGETGSEPPPLECTYVNAPPFGSNGAVDIGVTVIADGLATPWGMGWLPNGDLLITEREGRISRISDGVVTPIGTVPSIENAEGGLLGLAIDPDFDSNRYVYLYYTAIKGGGIVNRVARWQVSEALDSIAEVAVLVDDMAARQFHNGGRLRIGPDSKLYIGTGDAGEPTWSQDWNNPSGKILRVELDGRIPEDNPVSGSAAWVAGIRNTQGFDWRADGKMVITDHGPSGISNEGGRRDHDEVTLASPGDNLGWPEVYACEEGEGFTPASITWAKAMPPGGAAIYTGDEIPEWTNDFFIGVMGFSSDTPHLHRLRLDDGGNVSINEVYLNGEYGRLRDVIMGPDGGLYVSTSNCDGRGNCGDGDKILRIGAPQ